MDNITQVHFKEGQESIYGIIGLKQWDKGQKLEISGLHIDKDVEVHFSLQQYCGTAKRMLGKMVDGILHTDIPSFIMEGPEYICAGARTYSAYAWVYISDEESAETIRKMEFIIEARAKPDDYAAPEDKDIIQALKEDIESKADKNNSEISGSLSMGRLKGSAIGSNSATFGTNNVATSGNSFASGYDSNATGNVSFAGNAHTTASGYASFAIGENTLASSSKSYAEGHYTTSSGTASHAEGYSSIASDIGSHAEGFQTNATGGASHTEGANTIASGNSSHAEGQFNSAIGNYSHAEGLHNYAYSSSGHVQGRYASHDTLEQYAHIIGNGTNNEHRSNIHTVDWNGNGWYKGRLSQDGIPTSEKDLTPKKYIDDKLSDALECIMQVNDRLYEGRDLTQVHAKEIADFTDEWNWIKERIQARNYTGIHVGDYIPMNAENGNQTYNMQIAGIDTYYNTQDLKIGHHIDFISKECYIRPFQWNTTANNNGTSAKNSPYLASNIYKVLGELASAVLPQEVQNQIVEKKTIIERRYSSGGALTASTTQSVQYIGKLWLPSEYEVFGSVIRGTPEWSQGQAVQYPLFANSGKNRAKIMVGSNKIVNWWLLTTHYGDTTHICTVGKNASINGASNYTIYFPICFRIDDSVTG